MNKWFSVKDHTPPRSKIWDTGISEDCLITGTAREVSVAYLVYESGLWYSNEGDLCIPTHWMPLPELPKN